MNIEESKSLLGWVSLNKLYINTRNECDYHNIHTAIEILLTAYEQKCNYIKENEIYKKNLFDSYEEKCKELEKEKEDNKRLRKCHLQYEEMTGIDLLLPSKEE